MTSFSLPLYAIVGAQKGVDVGLPVLGVLLLAVVGPTAGRWYRGWEEPLAKEPAGVYIHDDGRPLLGRKLQGRSVREMRSLGLTIDDPPDA